MTLAARDDDAPLLRELQTSTAIGSITNRPAHKTSRPQACWNVSAKADCLRLVEILNQYPLRGRKSYDFAIWAGAVEWWVDGDPRKRSAGRDWTPLAYFKQRLHESKAYREPDGVVITPDPCLDSPDWPGYFAGFLTAEGSFGIYRSAPDRLKPRMSFRLRGDERQLVETLAIVTGIGRVYLRPATEREMPCVQWMCFSRPDMAGVVQLLDRVPPRGRKAHEYEIWREAVKVDGSGRPRSEIQRPMRALANRLSAARAYPPD